MPSDSARKKQQQKKRGGGGKGKGGAEAKSSGASPDVVTKSSHRSCTGVLSSHRLSRDIHLERLSITFHGAELLTDATLELNCGRRYGLVGLNGSGELIWGGG